MYDMRMDDPVAIGPMWEGRAYVECEECLFEGDATAWEQAGYMMWACPACHTEVEQEFDTDFYLFGYSE